MKNKWVTIRILILFCCLLFNLFIDPNKIPTMGINSLMFFSVGTFISIFIIISFDILLNRKKKKLVRPSWNTNPFKANEDALTCFNFASYLN